MRQISSDLHRRLKMHNQTKQNNADPKMSVQVTRARSAVMDSSYWTVETIRTKEGIGGIAVAPRRLKPYGRPDRLYEIHLDNGLVKTTMREYPDYQKDGWKAQFELGAGVSVALAFDGDWKLWRNRWRFQSNDSPWIFWVDSTGKLWTQHWSNEVSKLELSTDAVSVKAIRAWKNVNIETKDQGIVVAYIKTDGKVYYRNFCKQEDGIQIFETEKQLLEFTGIAVNLNLFLTNDYRMGFIVQDSSDVVWWYITDRNWAGMALGKESIYISAEAKVDFMPVKYHKTFEEEQLIINSNSQTSMLFGASWNEIESVTNVDDGLGNWGRYIEVIINNENFSIPTVALLDIEANAPLAIGEVTMVTTRKIRIMIDQEVEPGINNAHGSIQINLTNMINEAGYSFDDMQTSFLPVNLVPEAVALPEVLEVWNE